MAKKIFTVHASQNFLEIVVQYLNQKNLSKAIVILPREDDVLHFHSILKDSLSFKIISFENIDKEFLLHMKNIKIVTPMRRLFLMMEFIESWNKENDENYSLSFSYELLNFLNDVYINDISLNILQDICVEHFSEQSQQLGKFLCQLLKKWQAILNTEDVVDILEYRTLYLKNLLEFWNDKSSYDTIIFAGIVFNKSFMRFLRALYNLPNSQIIIPFIDLKMGEKYWHAMTEDNSQYYLKSLLDYLNITRNDVVLLGKEKINFIVESLFNFDEWLENFDKSNIKELDNNINLISCDSHDKEAKTILKIIKEVSIENIDLFVEDNLLLRRIDALLEVNNLQTKRNVDDYLATTFLLYSLNVVLSKCNIVELLSLLKHPFVKLHYSQKEYFKLLTEFEIKIIRFYRSYNMKNISENIKHYMPQLTDFWQKIKDSLDIILNAQNKPIHEIFNAHVACLNSLFGEDFVFSDGMKCIFHNFNNSYTTLSGLSVYKDILQSILNSNNLLNYRLRHISLSYKKTTILANFNSGYYPEHLEKYWISNLLQKKIGLFTFDEVKGHFSLILYSLFYSEKIYITRSIRSSGKINDDHFLYRKLNLLLSLYTKKSDFSFNNDSDGFKVINQVERPFANVNFNVKLKAFNLLSATAIEKLINDPYAFYLRYILKMLPLEGIDQEPQNKDFGTLVHKILETYIILYQKYTHTVDQCYDALIDIANSYFLDLMTHISHIWTMKFKNIAYQFAKIHIEKKRNVVKIEVEKAFYWKINSDITVVAKCDRIDYLEDGSVEIIDYKTGGIPSQSDIEKGYSPQLIIQALVLQENLEQEIKNLIYWRLGSNEPQIHCVKNHAEIIKETRQKLISFLNEYLYENIPFFTPCNVDKNARYIDYELLKRIGEWRLPVNI